MVTMETQKYFRDSEIEEVSKLFESLALRHIILQEGRLDEAGIWDAVKGTVGGVMKGIKNPNDAVNKLGSLAQQTKPVQEFDNKVDEIVSDIKSKLGNRSPKTVQTAEKYAAWAKKHPIKQGLIIGALTAIAALAAGPGAAAAAGFILRTTNEYMKGEKASTAVGKGVKTAVISGIAGAVAHWGLDKIANALSQTLTVSPRPFTIKNLSTLNFQGTMGSGHLVGPPDQIDQISKLRSQAFAALHADPAKAAELLQQAQNISDRLPELTKKFLAANEAYKRAYSVYEQTLSAVKEHNEVINATINRLKELATAGVVGAAASGQTGKAASTVAGAAQKAGELYSNFVPSKTFKQIYQQITQLPNPDKQKIINHLQQKFA
jgi:hypothetical protein